MHSDVPILLLLATVLPCSGSQDVLFKRAWVPVTASVLVRGRWAQGRHLAPVWSSESGAARCLGWGSRGRHNGWLVVDDGPVTVRGAGCGRGAGAVWCAQCGRRLSRHDVDCITRQRRLRARSVLVERMSCSSDTACAGSLRQRQWTPGRARRRRDNVHGWRESTCPQRCV